METKRFIGNDMPRIYARVRKEFGPDAIIVRTRSLLREGAEPLIEVLAAPPEADGELPLDLQRVLIDGALQRVQDQAKPLTVGDLEDLVAREAMPRPMQEPRQEVPQPPAPEWFEGYVDNAPQGPARPVEPVDAIDPPDLPSPRRFPGLPAMTPEPLPANDWARRPRPAIVTRRRESEHAREEPAAFQPRLPSSARGPGGLVWSLRATGFSELAARAIEAVARPEHDPAAALAATLEARTVRYPEDNRTALISIQGAPGSGRTTALMRMALDCAESGREAILLAADGSHVGGREQVRAYAEAIGLEAFDAFDQGEVVRVVGQAARGTCIFVDCPGGGWLAPAMPGIAHHPYLALPAHWHPGVARKAMERLPVGSFSGAILTFADLSTDLSPVLSLLVESPLGIAFLSSSRDVGTGIDVANLQTLASGIFAMRTRESTDGRLVASA